MSDPALVARARRLRAARGVVVARDVALAAAPGDVVAVEGPNGSGKSTLLAAAAGLLPADRASVRPGSVGYSPERSGLLPRVPLHRWLLGLARTAGLDRDESARRAGDLLARLGLAHASQVPLQALSRGNAQRALVAQALLADPDLLVLDEPSGGLDDDGVARVAAEIRRAAGRRAVVLVARHPAAPLPLPPGVTWQLRDGGVGTVPRSADREPRPAGTMEVETGDGLIQRAGAGARVLYGAAHRARLLASSQWFLAPAMLFVLVLAIIYATDAGPPLQAAAVTAITLVPVLTWLGVLAHRTCGRELARAFAAHVGSRARAHLAADLGVIPFALLLAAAALIAPLVSQGGHPHPLTLDAEIVGLHLAAAVFGAGLGSLLALIERAGWRLVAAVAVFLGLFLGRHTPLTPLLRLSTHPATLQASITGPADWLCLPGLALAAVAALLAARLT